MAATEHGTAPDDYIDTQLGERYYKGQKQLEETLTSEIIDVIHQFIVRRFQEGRRPARRDAHAQDNGCVRAIFRVDPDLDPGLRHGIFQPGKEYNAWIRFSNGNSEVLSGRFPDARGMAIKLTGVEGRKLLDDEKHTQDFILANRPVFFIDDLQRYKDTLVVFHSGGLVMQGLALIKLRGREIPLAIKNNASLITNPLFSQYWSMTPYRLGVDAGTKMAVKFSAKPRMLKRPGFLTQLQTFFSPGFSLKTEMNDTLSGNEMWFDFYIQRYVDDRTPIEDSKVEWAEDVSKPVHVAKIIIPMQDCISSEQDFFCENLSFNPWHSLPEHKPMGAVNRVRKAIYLRISELRHELNSAPRREPTGHESFDPHRPAAS
jgi:hypothetical protein